MSKRKPDGQPEEEEDRPRKKQKIDHRSEPILIVIVKFVRPIRRRLLSLLNETATIKVPRDLTVMELRKKIYQETRKKKFPVEFPWNDMYLRFNSIGGNFEMIKREDDGPVVDDDSSERIIEVFISNWSMIRSDESNFEVNDEDVIMMLRPPPPHSSKPHQRKEREITFDELISRRLEAQERRMEVKMEQSIKRRLNDERIRHSNELNELRRRMEEEKERTIRRMEEEKERTSRRMEEEKERTIREQEKFLSKEEFQQKITTVVDSLRDESRDARDTLEKSKADIQQKLSSIQKNVDDNIGDYGKIYVHFELDPDNMKKNKNYWSNSFLMIGTLWILVFVRGINRGNISFGDDIISLFLYLRDRSVKMRISGEVTLIGNENVGNRTKKYSRCNFPSKNGSLMIGKPDFMKLDEFRKYRREMDGKGNNHFIVSVRLTEE